MFRNSAINSAAVVGVGLGRWNAASVDVAAWTVDSGALGSRTFTSAVFASEAIALIRFIPPSADSEIDSAAPVSRNQLISQIGPERDYSRLLWPTAFFAKFGL